MAQVRFVPLVLCTYAHLSVIRHGSNFARLTDEQAHRLGFAALSAPLVALRPRRESFKSRLRKTTYLNYAPDGSKRRERPGERAPRYAFACLSAPDSLTRARQEGANLSCSKKQKKTATYVTVHRLDKGFMLIRRI